MPASCSTDSQTRGRWKTGRAPPRGRTSFVSEVERYATQYYIKSKRSGDLVQADQHTLSVALPQSGVATVTFLAASSVSLVSHFVLGPYLGEWSLVAATLICAAILVLSLTYLGTPNLTRLKAMAVPWSLIDI
jgi:antibiotic biosynthesis monooxygenase (ABM) superfamily enzyme